MSEHRPLARVILTIVDMLPTVPSARYAGNRLSLRHSSGARRKWRNGVGISGRE
jgi:hypothetical protein